MLWDFCPFILLLQRWESGSGGWAYRSMSREEYISLQNPEMIAVSIDVENSKKLYVSRLQEVQSMKPPEH